MRFAVAWRNGAWVVGACAVLLPACGSRTPLDLDPQGGGGGFGGSPISIDGSARADCFQSSQPVGEIPIDLYFMMDKSSSMRTFDRGQPVSRWNAVSQAMKTFINSPKSAGLGAGIAFFPRVDSRGSPLCSAADYAFPVVPIGILPKIAAAISTGISAQVLASNTPTMPALQGAHIYARTHRAQSGRLAAVVIVTDGEPRQCGSTVDTTAAVATHAAGGNPPIKTYVLGVGPSLTNLNAIALAGGTGRAYLVESGGEADLTAALDAIRTSALSCAYSIPEYGRATAEKSPAKVATRVGANGLPVSVTQVTNAAACANGAGWYYERPPITSDASTADTAPMRVTLCPASCDSLLKESGSHLDVIVGCEDAGAR
jgi:hypothetical protein